jgi:hypothetical protein
VRFDHAAHLLAAGHADGIVAAESGYVDQSHLHREGRAIIGATPSAVAVAPWLAIDDVAWPASSPTWWCLDREPAPERKSVGSAAQSSGPRAARGVQDRAHQLSEVFP